MGRLDLGELDAPVAHQGVDHVAAQHVVGVQAVAAHHRQPATFEPRLILGRFLDVLTVAVADLADRGDAKADKIAVRMGGVTLEVALQSAIFPGQRQLIIRQREVIHADVDIAGFGQAPNGQLEKLELALRRRHVFRADQPLGLEQLRQVGIAVGGDAVGPQGDDLAQGGVEAGHRLQRQAIDQVNADRLEPRIPGSAHQLDHLGLALNTIDRLLNPGVEVLDAKTQAIEAQPMQLMNLLRRDGARVDLQRELPGRRLSKVKGFVQRRHQFTQLSIAEIGWRTAAQMQLGHAPGIIKQRPLHGNFVLEPVQILCRTLMVVGDDLVAGAVVAQAFAERDMHIGRQRLGRRGPVAALGGGTVVILGEGGLKLRRGGIGRIARSRSVIFLDQGANERQGVVHG